MKAEKGRKKSDIKHHVKKNFGCFREKKKLQKYR